MICPQCKKEAGCSCSWINGVCRSCDRENQEKKKQINNQVNNQVNTNTNVSNTTKVNQ